MAEPTRETNLADLLMPKKPLVLGLVLTLTACDNGMVEMGGIEPPSIAEDLRLLRAHSMKTFYSAPTFVMDT